MKNCEYYEELIGAAIDGEITAEEDKELRAHLESCGTCRSFYEAMQAIAGADNALGEPPEDFTATVMALVHKAAAPQEKAPAKKKTNITRLVTRYGALAAVAAAAIWAGTAFFGAKGSSGAAPETAMFSMPAPVTEETAVCDEAADAAPAEAAPRSMTAAAPDTAAANDAGGGTVTVTAEKCAADGALTISDDGFFAGYLLLSEGETPAPERSCDYVLTLAAPDGTESEYRLWIEEERVIWQEADGGAAHLSPATPEALSEILNNASK